jgi:hypothetical protein
MLTKMSMEYKFFMHIYSSFYAQKNRGICGVLLESNVGVIMSLCDLQ